MDAILDLQAWYLSNCNGDWEHDERIHIGTLDNPGWSLQINFEGTTLSGKSFIEVSYGVGENGNTSGNEWLVCKVVGNTFKGHGGPEKLGELLNVFLSWARAA